MIGRKRNSIPKKSVPSPFTSICTPPPPAGMPRPSSSSTTLTLSSLRDLNVSPSFVITVSLSPRTVILCSRPSSARRKTSPISISGVPEDRGKNRPGILPRQSEEIWRQCFVDS